ncbi:MAG TPA: metal ABC transporter ATP-binding protein [Gemmata sp.]|nr:metal ABC transporter ATP-binding protein [Gemmata sp.]
MSHVRAAGARSLPVLAPKPLVAIRDLVVELGGSAILRGVTAEIARGKITAVVGLNGSGKTTLLRALVGEFPYRGVVNFHCGHDHSHPTPEHVGYVPQRLIIDARLPLTVRDLFSLALSHRPLFFGIPRWVSARAAELMERVGMPEILDNPVEGLSGGQLQRVLLALALEPSPELMLLDEPASGIDFKDQKKFYDLISRINDETGLTVILVSHDLSMVSAHADHVLCLRDGRIACQGAPAEILTPENLAITFGAEMMMFPLHNLIQ